MYIFYKAPSIFMNASYAKLCTSCWKTLGTLQISVVCHDSFVTREASISQQKTWNHYECTCASECHFFLMAFKPGDQMSIKYDRRVGFSKVRSSHKPHEVKQLVRGEKKHQEKSCTLNLLVFTSLYHILHSKWALRFTEGFQQFM